MRPDCQEPARLSLVPTAYCWFVMPVPMVGRAAAVDELRRAWARVQQTRRAVPAVVTGLPGTGKTALVAAAAPAGAIHGSARLHSPAPYDWLAAVLAGREV